MSNQVEKLVVFPRPDGKFWVRRMQWEIKDDGPHFISYVGDLTEADKDHVDVKAYLVLNSKDQRFIGNVEPKDVAVTGQPAMGSVQHPAAPNQNTEDARGLNQPGTSRNPRT